MPEEEKAKEKASSTGWWGGPKSHYDGPFEDKMTRREAALILGIRYQCSLISPHFNIIRRMFHRESATKTRIKNENSKLLMLNHVDKGGSTFISGKVNEAKELLMKTAED